MAGAVYICGDQPVADACPRCGQQAVVQGLGYFPPECTACGWDAVTGSEEWRANA
jgi:uncharacterized protein (DUF983 family)